MVLKSYSKINLSLKLILNLKNGLHEIQSYFV
jgi:4-diphosphocytidyl-2C-methyl-D-erythritol kinase